MKVILRRKTKVSYSAVQSEGWKSSCLKLILKRQRRSLNVVSERSLSLVIILKFMMYVSILHRNNDDRIQCIENRN